MEGHTQVFDLAIAWNWEYDLEFINLIEQIAQKRGISTYLIHHRNVEEAVAQLHKGKISFRVVLDRASDEEESFHSFVRTLARRPHAGGPQSAPYVINPYDLQKKASDKATMHLEFLTAGLEVPYTIIISPYSHRREMELSLSELAHLGRPFIIKPANTTGGGVGVVMGAESLKDILDARQHHKNDKYLLQETIKPAYLSENRAWFRVFSAFGKIVPCWWDDESHLYQEVTTEDEETFGLLALRQLTARIRDVCQLDFFSTELAYTLNDKFVVVDYVNEICDMRLQSRHPDGVPDRIVEEIATSLVDFVEKKVH